MNAAAAHVAMLLTCILPSLSSQAVAHDALPSSVRRGTFDRVDNEQFGGNAGRFEPQPQLLP